MDQALELFYYLLNKSLNFFFNSYLFPGVSLGLLLVVSFIFVVLFNYLLALPKYNYNSKNVSKYNSKGGDRSASKKASN